MSRFVRGLWCGRAVSMDRESVRIKVDYLVDGFIPYEMKVGQIVAEDSEAVE